VPGATCLSRAKIPALSTRRGVPGSLVAEQVQPAIAAYEQPNRSTWMSF
jgi:hypothetical protein